MRKDIFMFKRSSGVLMGVSSLPSNWGIGTLGKEAYRFVDCLCEAKQTYWQILPLGPTSFGDSPYQSFSSYAGNPYFIDPEILCEMGYLTQNDLSDLDFGTDATSIDYGKLYHNRRVLFESLQASFFKSKPADFDGFCYDNAHWLDDYALFMSIKDEFNGASLDIWPIELRKREIKHIEEAKERNKERILYYKMLQFLFFKQWFNLKSYANRKGIEIFGDVPIYVARDSVDVWVNPDVFMLNEDLTPKFVAGCPPDAFSEDGQLWGNPVYDWENIKKNDYEWWLKRLKRSFEIYDVVRIDHFRAFEAFYCIPFGSDNAKNGHWQKGPDMDFFNTVKLRFGELKIVAEDLGLLTPEVYELLKNSGFPGMKVLQFAFSPDGKSDYMLRRHKPNSIVYTGTHDNDTLVGFAKNGNENEVRFAKLCLGCPDENKLPEAMMKAALASVSNVCILTMQDLLGLDSAARMNTPSTDSGNWRWRAKKEQICSENFEFLKKYTVLLDRAK